MRHSFFPLLLILPIFLAPVVVLGADAKPKAGETSQAAGGDKFQQPATDQAQAEPNADTDNADAEKVDFDKPKRPKTGARPTSIAVTSVPGGLKTVTIHFRWSLFPNASIEVRLVPGEPKEGATVTPIYFSEHLKGTVREALYTCLDHTGEGGHTHSFTKDKIVYKMIGRRNSLGKQGVHVQVHPEESDQDANPAAAYLQLDTWAVGQETLSLDLARDEFAKSGVLFVWFFRGDQTVWEEQIRWPGYK
ncbi:MAG: hypothetical protein WCJ35_17790 [Planctomycetota bacterium]